MYMKHAYVKVMCTLTDIHEKKIFSIHKAIGDDLLVVVGSHFQTDIQYRRLRSFCTSPLSTRCVRYYYDTRNDEIRPEFINKRFFLLVKCKKNKRNECGNFKNKHRAVT